LPRARLVRWCVLASRRRGAAAASKVEDELASLWPGATVDKSEFVASVELVYREQRFVQAAVDSLGNLHRMMHNFLIGCWAFMLGLAAIFLVDWGFALDGWLLPLSSGMLSVAFLSGRVPYEVAAGIVYVVLERPYDIGDRIYINSPGATSKDCEPLIVLQIGMLSTICSSPVTEDQHIMQNYVLRGMGVINLARSSRPSITLTVDVPARTSAAKLTELVEAVYAYAGSVPAEWAEVQGHNIAPVDYRAGAIELQFYLLSAYKRVQVGDILKAKGRAYIFIHEYQRGAGFEMVRPTQPLNVRFELRSEPIGAAVEPPVSRGASRVSL